MSSKNWDQATQELDIPEGIEEKSRETYQDRADYILSLGYEDALELDSENIAKGIIYSTSVDEGEPITPYQLLDGRNPEDITDQELLENETDLLSIDAVYHFQSKVPSVEHSIPFMIDGDPGSTVIATDYTPEGLGDYTAPLSTIADTRHHLSKAAHKQASELDDIFDYSEFHGKTNPKSLSAASVYLGSQTENLGLTQEQISNAADVSVPTIGKWAKRIEKEDPRLR